MAAVVGLTLMVAYKSPSSVYENHPCLYILAFGIVVAKVTNRLVVCIVLLNTLKQTCFLAYVFQKI